MQTSGMPHRQYSAEEHNVAVNVMQAKRLIMQLAFEVTLAEREKWASFRGIMGDVIIAAPC